MADLKKASGIKKPVKKKRGDIRRDALVQSAAGLFWTNGYGATSLADVAARANVPLGNLYYYFKTKADLALGVANLFVDQTELLIAAVCEAETDSRKRLQLLVERIRATQGERVTYGCPIAAACRDFRIHAPDAAERAAESYSILMGFIAQELARTGARPSVGIARARQVISDWQGGIALAHGLQQSTPLLEAYGRMERVLAQ